ncbi:MAG TPA: ATP-dependent DNA helicase RecQ [Bacteroidia bacterium]|nr:ATP-dependent DNA helicase RecQ [Bacteroidia bacterium]
MHPSGLGAYALGLQYVLTGFLKRSAALFNSYTRFSARSGFKNNFHFHLLPIFIRSMPTNQDILKQYWGHTSFRPLQEDIINSVLNGNDTLALLPTGGGKSVCFQIPALVKTGMCLVISPLIALMKDQVENLLKKNIKAIAITSSMHKKEIDIALDNCVHGAIKFLYLSPERLETEIVKMRLPKMNINLIAIDESHCISQWGYDFRPSYLKLENLRELLPGVPFLALTATATPEVVKDIQQKLHFKKTNVLQKSFERNNLSYLVLREEDKLSRLVKIIRNVNGSGIVYTRNRRKTQDIATYLRSHHISADFYHAGLDAKTRDSKQNNWIQNNSRIMVCTNAFGMGIDKPDVRFVVHIDVPDSIEGYFQEAGRAGRDEKKAFAVLLYNKHDELELQRNLENSFPTMEEIRQTYQAIVNYYQMPAGSGEGVSVNFDIVHFCDTYKLQPIVVYNSLKFIEREGYISLTDAVFQPSRIKLEMNREDLYKFQLSNNKIDAFIKLLLRSYSGLFDNFIKINEWELAKKTNSKQEDIVKRLNYLHQQKVITYAAQTELPQLIFERPRVHTKDLSFAKENFSLLKKRAEERVNSIIHYAGSTHKCRSQLLLAYFGETNTLPCKQCDVCLETNKKTLHTDEFENISAQIKELLAVHPMPLKKLVDAVTDNQEDKIIHTIQWMIDNSQIKYNNDNQLFLAN